MLRYGQIEIHSIRGMSLECNLSVSPGKRSVWIQARLKVGQGILGMYASG